MNSPARRVALASLVLLCAAVVASGPLAAQPTELFISEYVEGSSNNKALELYNGTGAAIDLAAGGYNVQMFFNGSASAGLTINLTGTVANGDVFVLAQASSVAAILAQADQTNGSGWYNGDDAVALRKGTTVIDSIGVVGTDPGTEWGTGLASTADNTLRRKAAVCTGDTNTADAFNPATEWDGFAQDTFGGLGSHTSACRVPVINEFSANTAGTDVEFVEVYGTPRTNLSAFRILEIEGDSGTSVGTIDEVVPLGTTDANGFYLASLPANALENGSVTILLVEGFTGALNQDLDTNNDGVLDTTPWARVVDAVAINDGGATDFAYGVPTLGVAYDGLSFAPGGASRIPDGTDTNTTADWVRNDFDLAGITGITGSPVFGEAYNTPGGANVRVAAAEAAPSVVATTPANGALGVPAVEDLVVSFSEPVAFTAAAFTLECPAGTPIGFTVSGSGTTTARIDPTVLLPEFTACTASVLAANVTDVDAADPPDTMAANFAWGFTTGSATPTLSVNDVTVTEGNAGTVVARFTVQLTFPAGTSGVTFDIAAADGTATTANGDYVAQSLSGQTIPSGGSSYTFDVTVNGDTTVEPTENFFVNVTSVVGANVGDGQGQGTITNDDIPVAEIFAIQGSGAASPFAGQAVSTQNNVVTAVGPEGFFIQTPAARDDADPATSSGIYVFTGAAPTVAVGDVVDVTGTVTEYYDFTEFSPVTSVTIDSSSNPLPDAIEFGATFPSPNPAAPSCGAGLGLECIEGMLVHVANGITSGPNQRFASDLSAEIHGVGSSNRPFREPGIEFPGLVGLPVWDGNPEVFEIDPDRLGAVSDPDYVPAGSTYSATGVMGYEFSGWELWPTAFSFAPPALPRAVRARNAGEFTVGTYNLYLLDSGASDYAARLQKHSAYIRTVLGAPDVLGVQECMSLTELTGLAARIHADDATLTYAPYLVEGHDIGGIDVGFLVRDTVTDAVVTQLGYSEVFAWDGSFLHDRPPLLLEANYAGNGAPFAFTVMVNHTRSLNSIDDPVDGDRVRAKRLAQAQSIAQMIQDYQTANPLRPFAMVGDLNAYEISDGYVDVVGQMAGDFVPADNLLSGPDLVNPDLTKQALNVAAGDRYSYNFEGTAQVLDHALTTQATNSWVRGFEYGRGNTDSAVNLLYDAGTPLRSSDHDGAVLFLMSDANADGVPDDRSPAALAATKAAVGSFVPGSLVTYAIVLGNTSAFVQLDNPGDELTDVLPAPLVLVSATATSGTAVATVPTNTVTWNGTIPAGGTVTVTISAAVPLDAVVGTTISNQATISYDADGDGTNETAGVSDDPATTSAGDATVFAVADAGSGLATIPVLDGVGLGLLAALVALGGALLLGRRIS